MQPNSNLQARVLDPTLFHVVPAQPATASSAPCRDQQIRQDYGKEGITRMPIETLDRRTMTQDKALSIAELLSKVWPRRTAEVRAGELLRSGANFQGPEAFYPRSLVIREGDRVIAHAGVAGRIIGTSQGDITILALSQVCTDPDVRGRKLGQTIARAALDLVDHGPFPFALFQTKDEVRPFYESLGAKVATNRFVNSLGENSTANPFWDAIQMRYPAGPDWPAGEIDLRGPGF